MGLTCFGRGRCGDVAIIFEEALAEPLRPFIPFFGECLIFDFTRM
jgi:hypothetical protein